MFIAVSADKVIDVLHSGVEAKVASAIVNASGFADSGEDGLARQKKVQELCRNSGMLVCGPNTNGLISVVSNASICTFAAPTDLKVGRVAAYTQSGSFANMLSRDVARLGLSYVVAGGNEAVLGASDFLRAFIMDDRIDVVLLALETIRNPSEMALLARQAADKGKTVLALKVGRSELGGSVVQGHTGALAGEDEVYEAYFRQNGIVRVDDLDELVETAAIYSKGKSRSHEGAVVLSLSGGHAALLADLAEDFKVPLATLSKNTEAGLNSLYPDWWKARNPIDAWGDGWDAVRFRESIRIISEDDNVGVVVVALMPQPSVRIGGEIAEILKDVAAKSGKAFVILNDSSGGSREAAILSKLEGSDVPYLSGFRNGMRALSVWRNRSPIANHGVPVFDNRAEVTGFFDHAGTPKRESEQFSFLRSVGLPMASCRRVSSLEEALKAFSELGTPAVLKGAAPDILHKSERGLVALDLRSGEDVDAAYRRISRTLEGASSSGLKEVVVQSQAEAGIELIVGVRNYPGFGSLLVVGLGGIFVELLKESSKRIGPVDRSVAIEMLDETSAGKLLRGFRGKGRFDIDAAAQAIETISRLGDVTMEHLAAFEINPLIIHAAGKGATAVDFVVEYRK